MPRCLIGDDVCGFRIESRRVAVKRPVPSINLSASQSLHERAKDSLDKCRARPRGAGKAANLSEEEQFRKRYDSPDALKPLSVAHRHGKIAWSTMISKRAFIDRPTRT